MYGLMGGDVQRDDPNAGSRPLQREAEICYANCSLVTNMGSGLSWTALSHEEVVAMMDENAKTIARIIHAFPNRGRTDLGILSLPGSGSCCGWFSH